MSNIQKYEAEDIGYNFTPSIYEANAQPTIRDENNQSKMKQGLILAINKSYFEFGKAMNEMDFEITKQLVIQDLIKDFSFLTVHEIYLAFRNGIRGKYGAVYRYSVATCYGWVDSYCKLERQKALNKKISANNDKLKIEHAVKPEDVPKTQDLLMDQYNKFVKSGKYSIKDYGDIFYDFLLNKGLIEFDKNEKKDIWEEAKQQLYLEHTLDKAKTEIQRNMYSQILNNLSTNNTDPHNFILRSYSRAIKLRRLLTSYRNANVDLEHKLSVKTNPKNYKTPDNRFMKNTKNPK